MKNNIITKTKAQLEKMANKYALELGAKDRFLAYKLLDNGEFNGTILQAELSMLRFMLDE